MLIALAVVRTLIGLFFAAEGVMGFMARDSFSDMFTRWHIPSPEISVPIFAATAGACGFLLMIGWLVRPAALAAATLCAAATMTAGRVDGGAYVVAPPLLFAALAYYAWRSGRHVGWATTRRPRTQ